MSPKTGNGTPQKTGAFLGALSFTLFFWASASFAAPEVSMSIDKQSILLGDSVTFTVTVRNVDRLEPPELPDIPEVDAAYKGMRQESFSSFTMIVQGQQIQQRQSGGGLYFDYELTPRAVGTVTVPPFSIVVDGQTFRTSPFEIEVVDRSERSEDIFLDVSVDKADAYLGEKILLTVSWYFNKDIHAYRLNIPWLTDLKNFLITDPEPDPSKRYQNFAVNDTVPVAAEKTTEFYKGQQYAVIRFQKILTPTATGAYTLDPVFLKCDVVKGYTRNPSQNFFDDFFDSDFDNFFSTGGFRQAVTEPFSTRSLPLTITVHEVPNVNRPADYSGAVGHFDFKVSASPTRLKAGEPVTLTMKVSGSGNIERVELPPMPELDNFKSYEPESQTHVKQVAGELVGEKIFEKVLIARSPGAYQIPALTFTYFNPSLRDYRTITQGPFDIEVEKGSEENEVQVIALDREGAPESQKREIQVLKQDIRYIKADLGRVTYGTEDRGVSPVAMAGAFAFPPILLGILWGWRRQQKRLVEDVGFARHKKALTQAETLLKEAERAIKNPSSRAFYDTLLRALMQYLADKLNQPPAAVTADFIASWAAKNMDPKEAEALRGVLSRSELALFSSVESSAEQRKEDLSLVRRHIQHWERRLK